ncbi:MAG: hypothetical protein ACE5R4_00235 [Armatimonadota bacterium]
MTLETSLKPFRSIEPEAVTATCREVFRQWQPLIDVCDRVAVMLWTGDGTEIFEWRGRLDDPLPWALSIGFCNAERGMYPWDASSPQPRRDYMDEPPSMTYETLRTITTGFKEVGQREFGLDVTIGATVDPGPEFVESYFKYERHREIFRAGPDSGRPRTVGFICAYASLDRDERPYAGFPEGIPQGTSFGTFLGRQCRSFLAALGFDYLWLSNGMGFSHYAWYLVGENFDGQDFGCVDYAQERERVLSFWRDLAAEVSDIPLELRGTNFPMGVDLAADCVSFEDIYRLAPIVNPPVNPPWGSRDLGMEVMAHLSRIAHLPPRGTYAVRHYLNDPWFYANPWWDYYNREPFDIYCPWVCARINRRGEAEPARFMELLTIDTERGELNENTALETIPHMRRAVAMAPDAPGPLTLVYPFREYHELAREHPEQIGQAYFADLFLRCAVQNGLPLNTVVSTDNLTAVLESRASALADTVLLAPVPRQGWACGGQIRDWVRSGGTAMLFGPLAAAGDEVRELLGVSLADPIEGELIVQTSLRTDEWEDGQPPSRVVHRSALSGGPIVESAQGEEVVATARQAGEQRALALIRREPSWDGGAIAWLRGSLPLHFRPGSTNPIWADNVSKLDTSVWLRYLLAELGWAFVQRRHDPAARCLYTFVSRKDNAYVFTGHKPDATARLLVRFPQGAPLITERETRLRNGLAEYALDRSYQHECRVFVEQRADTLLGCKEQQHPTGTSRRLLISGLADAEVTLYPSAGAIASETVAVDGAGDPAVSYDKQGECLTMTRVTGDLTVTW